MTVDTASAHEIRLPTVSPNKVDQGERQRTHEDDLKGWKVNRLSDLDQQGASDHCVTESHMEEFDSVLRHQPSIE